MYSNYCAIAKLLIDITSVVTKEAVQLEPMSFKLKELTGAI